MIVSEVAEGWNTEGGVSTQLVQQLVAQFRQLRVGVVNSGNGCGQVLGMFHQHQDGVETSTW